MRIGPRVNRADIFARCCLNANHEAALRAVKFLLQHGYAGRDSVWPSLHVSSLLHDQVSMLASTSKRCPFYCRESRRLAKA